MKFFYSGLSGIQLPIPKYRYPPEYQDASRLQYYGSFFNSIELNSTFYKIPRSTTVANWSTSVHDTFRFTFKLFKEVTHVKENNFDESTIHQFIETINSAGTKKGCLLVQFPPSFRIDSFHHMERILEIIRNANSVKPWPVAIEFRNSTWYVEEVYELIKQFQATLVIHDKLPIANQSLHFPSSEIYVRFHGPAGNYKGSYSDDFLQEYSSYINEWLAENKTVYVYFNNTAGDAFNNCLTLNKMVG
jgi:uncharacterized protein YecE (DUF72 family)